MAAIGARVAGDGRKRFDAAAERKKRVLPGDMIAHRDRELAAGTGPRTGRAEEQANVVSSFIAIGGDEPVAEISFNQTPIDGYFMEWDAGPALRAVAFPAQGRLSRKG